MMTEIIISAAKNNHLDALRTIELASFETLREAGAVEGSPMATSPEELSRLCREGLLLVALTKSDIPVGFAGAWIVDNWLHIAEVDVHPDWQRRGIGRQLMKRLLSEGQARDLNGVSLTTDRYAPFNANFYASMGFRIMESNTLSPRLEALLKAEINSGLDPQRRVAMQYLY